MLCLNVCRSTRSPLASISSGFFNIHTAAGSLQPVPKLSSWSPDAFRRKAFAPAQPACLPVISGHLPPAIRKWFIHHDSLAADIAQHGASKHSALRESFWKDHESLMVPLELTLPATNNPDESTFHRSDVPLKLLLDHLTQKHESHHSIYLAQCPLPSLPPALQADLPTPQIILAAGRGDVYDSSLWMGRPPTYTPLHRDPNPNILMQLAGTKVVRLFPPNVGLAIFEQVQERLGEARSSVFRGEEMMQGAEKDLLERAVWSDAEPASDAEGTALRHAGFEATISLGEAVFIPKGWWHSVRGVGRGVTASVNWWFR